MSTRADAPYLLRRVVTRAGLGVWRNRGGVVVAALLSIGIGGYAALTWSGGLASPLAAAAGVGNANTDCADTAMAAVADRTPTAAQRAYQCMDSTFQQRVTEADFARQVQAQQMPSVNKLARVGDYHTAAGGTMVYYALDGGAGQSVGYIVYVGQNGKVLRIE